MKASNLINQNQKANSINYNELSLEKLEEYITLLEEYQLQNEKSGKFIEAELAKQRIIQLSHIIDKKRYKEAKIRQKEEREDLEKKQKEELRLFNEDKDKEFFEMSQNFEEMQRQLDIEQGEEAQKFEEEYNAKQIKFALKPSSDLINLNKQLELYVKKKDYPNAHMVQVEIAELTKKENEANQMERERRLEKELENVRQRQMQKRKALEQFILNNYNKFKRDRALKVEELLLKYKNKIKELENYHKSENMAFEKIIKGEAKKPKNSLVMGGMTMTGSKANSFRKFN